MSHDPLSPSEALRTPVGAAVAALSVITVAYSLVIVAQLLLGLLVGVALPVSLYLSYRAFAALDAVADAAQRIAAAREREADEGSRFGGAAEGDSQPSRSSDRITERER